MQPYRGYGRYGPLVDRDLLLEFVMPEIEKIGKGKFAERCHIGPRALTRVLNGEGRTTHHTADRLLTLGLGRPDLLDEVCPSLHRIEPSTTKEEE
jgi:hypothetical protein